jgi:hypothetical protein
MFKQLAALLQVVFTLAKDLEQNRADIKELRRDLLNLTLLVQRLSDEIKMSSYQEASEREKLALRLKVEMLRFEQHLPPKPDGNQQG